MYKMTVNFIVLLIIIGPVFSASEQPNFIELSAILDKITSLENEVITLKNVVEDDNQTILKLTNDNAELRTRLDKQDSMLSSYKNKHKQNDKSQEECRQKLQSHEKMISRLTEMLQYSERPQEGEHIISDKTGLSNFTTKTKPLADIPNGARSKQAAVQIPRMHRSNVIRQSVHPNIAFHAVTETRTTDHVGINQNVHFETVLLNNGNGYDNQHGIFTAPASGVYMFSTAIDSTNGHRMDIKLVKNGESYGVTASSESATYDLQGDVTAIMQLSVGDEVWVASTDYANTAYSGDRWTYFCGVMLYNV